MSSILPIPTEPVDHLQYPIPDGPWMDDIWHVPRPDRHATAGSQPCAVLTCDLPAGRALGDRIRLEDVLCVPHRRRLDKAAKVPLAQYIEEQGRASRICRPRGANTRKATFAPIAFTQVHPQLAHELRYVIAIKTGRQHWRAPSYVVSLLREAVTIGAERGYTSLRQFPTPPPKGNLTPAARAALTFPGRSNGATAHLVSALGGMIAVLDAWCEDPWSSDTWHHSDVGVTVAQSATVSVIRWSSVTCIWLRSALKQLAREQLQSGSRSWSTISTHARGGSLFSRFLDNEVGSVQPAEVTRGLFLDFVAWVRDETTKANDRNAVNSLARTLVELRAEGVVKELPETTFLLRGENPVRKKLLPKPFPADILAGLDSLMANDQLLPADMRLMLRLFRATGPRASEALLMPRDSIRHTEGRGHSLEYFQSKTQEWRRVPLPPQLGRDLAQHAAEVAEEYGPGCPWLFPYFGPGSRANTLVDGVEAVSPWPYGRFTAEVWAAYQRAGVTSSALTGEVLTGAQLHRFRHSIATGLLNEGWSQYEVQKFLGHKSPTMMQAYAEINEDRLRDKYMEFAKHAIDVDGQPQPSDVRAAADVERLRNRMIRTTLPNGYCTLPEKLACDFAPTPCLTCKPYFRTTPTFLPIHIRQRDDAMRELEVAKSDGRERATQAHEQTVARLDTIITGLEAEVLSQGRVDQS